MIFDGSDEGEGLFTRGTVEAAAIIEVSNSKIIIDVALMTVSITYPLIRLAIYLIPSFLFTGLKRYYLLI